MTIHDDEVLEALNRYWRQNYHSPSRSELKEITGVGLSGLHNALYSLQDDGKIIVNQGRGIPVWVVERLSEKTAILGL